MRAPAVLPLYRSHQIHRHRHTGHCHNPLLCSELCETCWAKASSANQKTEVVLSPPFRHQLVLRTALVLSLDLRPDPCPTHGPCSVSPLTPRSDLALVNRGCTNPLSQSAIAASPRTTDHPSLLLQASSPT